MIQKYRVIIKLFNCRTISDYVIADSPENARHRAFKYALPRYKNARPEYLGIAFTSGASFDEIKRFKNESK